MRKISPPSSHPGITAPPPQAAARSKGDIPALACLHFVRPAGVRVAFRFLFFCEHRPGHSPCVVIVLKQNMATKLGHLRASHDMALHSCLLIMSRLTSASSCRLRHLHEGKRNRLLLRRSQARIASPALRIFLRGNQSKTKALPLCCTTFTPECITSTLDRGAIFGRVASGPREAKEFI